MATHNDWHGHLFHAQKPHLYQQRMRNQSYKVSVCYVHSAGGLRRVQTGGGLNMLTVNSNHIQEHVTYESPYPSNLLQWLIKTDGGGAVEDDVNVVSQDTLILFTQTQ